MAVTQSSRRPGRYGYGAPGGGRVSWVESPVEYRGTTVQVCGMWPLGTGSSIPIIGVPLGRHIYTGATICFDPISWFEQTGLIANPSMYVAAKPAMGKALDVDTEVPTPDGTRLLGELRPGDLVFDENGRPTAVVATSPVWEDRECYAVRFSDGSEVVADAEHLWVTRTQQQRQRSHNQRAQRRWPSRRALALAADQRRVAHLLASTRPGQLTTLPQLGSQLGWDRSRGARWQRLYRWGSQLAPLGSAESIPRLYDQATVLEHFAATLAAAGSPAVASSVSKPVTTKEIADTLWFAGKRNHAISTCRIETDHAPDLPVDPRLLGLWLGDGDTSGACFTTADACLVEEFRAHGFRIKNVAPMRYSIASRLPEPVGIGQAVDRRCAKCARSLTRKSTSDFCPPCRQRASLRCLLREAGVLGNKCIPTRYLRASVEQRSALLSGLLDTDGTVSSTGQIQYTTVTARLAADVHELACSLGYRATIRVGRAVLEGVDCGPKYTVGFTTADSVFRLPRKQALQEHRGARYKPARNNLRYITEVVRVASRPVRCIQVANPSGMYLVTRAYIATHNSTMMRRMVIGLAGQGITPMVLGDLKPDYAQVVAALGGQVIRVGPGQDRINPLDVGPWRDVLSRARGKAADELRHAVISRRVNLLVALMTLIRQAPVSGDESTVVTAVVRYLAERETERQPVLSDVLAVLRAAPDEVRKVTLWHSEGTAQRFAEETAPLQRTLLGLLHGALGSTFEGQTTTPIDVGTPAVCVDISSIDETDVVRTAATLLTTWSYGFAQVEAANMAADLGLTPQRRFFTILDELWRVLRTGHGLIDRADALTRLNRAKGTGNSFISHSVGEWQALADPTDQAKARGFAERSAMLAIGACSQHELDEIEKVVPLSQRERREILSWSAPSSYAAGEDDIVVGRGNFLLKVGDRPGIPLHLVPTDREKTLGNTNARWRMGGGR